MGTSCSFATNLSTTEGNSFQDFTNELVDYTERNSAYMKNFVATIIDCFMNTILTSTDSFA